MSERRRLGDAVLTPDQKAAVEARRARRETPEYKAGLAHDVAAYRGEFPPVPAAEDNMAVALLSLRLEREKQGLSLTDLAERTGIDRATISKLETGKITNPTVGTLRTVAGALGKRLCWVVEDKP